MRCHSFRSQRSAACFLAVANQQGQSPSPVHITKRQLIGELAEKHRIPAIYPFRSFVEAGGLISYGIALVEIFRRAARVIDLILKGGKPADIPFYQPTKFEFVINRTAAKELGLAISEPLLARAYEFIE
jgi:putative ABC transport system substrate-binding protein